MNDTLVAVTGANGFIGRRLTDELVRRGAKVRAVLRSAVDGPWQQVIVHDLGSGPMPHAALHGVDTVFHLAGRAHELADELNKDEPYQRVNVTGTLEVADAAVRSGVKQLVYVSSVKAMGEGGPVRLNEDDEERPMGAYGRSKLAAERALLTIADERELTVRIVRPCLVFGPEPVGNLQRLFKLMTVPIFPILDIADNKRSMIHVDDVVGAMLALAQSDRCARRAYVLSGPCAYSTQELQRAMALAIDDGKWRCSMPSGVIRALAKVGDVAGKLLRRRMPLDSHSFEKLSESAWYDDSALVADTGFRSERRLEPVIQQWVKAWRSGV